MPLDRLVLILVIVMIAAGVSVWVGAIAVSALQLGGFAWAVVIPAALVAYVVWRVIAESLSNSEDDHYDQIEK